MPPITILKLGGSILATDADAARATHEIYRWLRQGHKVIAIVSALEGTTDALLTRASSWTTTPLAFSSPAAASAAATLLSTGELQSAAILALALDRAGIPAQVLDHAAINLRTTGPALDATPTSLDFAALLAALDRAPVAVIPGFTGRDEHNRITTLGRGGSDLSTLFIAQQLKAALALPPRPVAVLSDGERAGQKGVPPGFSASPDAPVPSAQCPVPPLIRCRLIKDVPALYTRDPALPGPPPRAYATLSWPDALALDGTIVQHKAVRFAQTHRLPFEVAGLLSPRSSLVGDHAITFDDSPAPSPRRGSERRGEGWGEGSDATHAQGDPIPPTPARDAMRRPRSSERERGEGAESACALPTRPLQVAILGPGTVGRGVIDARDQLPRWFTISSILCRDTARAIASGLDPALVTTDPDAVFATRPDIIIETLGGLEPAHTLIRRALTAGIPVATANKAVIADASFDLATHAADLGVPLLFSAAVGGAVPMLETARHLAAENAYGNPVDQEQTHDPAPSPRRGFARRGERWGEGKEQPQFKAVPGTPLPALPPLSNTRTEGECDPSFALTADPITTIEGVLNGTTNFILARSAAGDTFEGAVRAAQLAGFAEADPSRDLDGRDAADKLALLIRAAFNQPFNPADIERTPLDAAACAQQPPAPNLTLKHLARAERLATGRIRATIRPTWLPANSPIALTRNEENAATVTTASGRATTITGKGAGRHPTTLAVLADLIDLAHATTSPSPACGGGAREALRSGRRGCALIESTCP